MEKVTSHLAAVSIDHLAWYVASRSHSKALCCFESLWQSIESCWNLVPMQRWHSWRRARLQWATNPSEWGWYLLLGVIICRLNGLVSELELHKHSIWPSLIYAQRQIFRLDAESRLLFGEVIASNQKPTRFALLPWLHDLFSKEAYLSWTLQLDANTAERLER